MVHQCLEGQSYYQKEIKEKIKSLNSKEFVVKAQIHAGGRRKSWRCKVSKGS